MGSLLVNSVVCKVLKGLFVTGWLCVAAPEATATIYYVDMGCPSAGTGISTTCGTTGPVKTITAGIAKLTTAGDRLQVRGFHTTHGACLGMNSNTGVYTTNVEGNTIFFGKSGASGNPVIMENFGYTGTRGSGETAVIEAVKFTTSGWTLCSSVGDCTSGTCSGVPAASCPHTWYYTYSGGKEYFGRKPAGGVTPLQSTSTLSAIVNTYDAATTSEASNTIFVKWGPTVTDPNNTQGVGVNDTNRDIMWISSNGSCGGVPSNLTIQGMTFRNGSRTALQICPSSTNVSIVNNIMTVFNDSAAGSARTITVTGNQTNLNIYGNEISQSTSEPIHIENITSSGITGSFHDNWIHDIGATSILGAGPANATPNCTTFRGPDSGSIPGDYSGFPIYNNVWERCNKVHVGDRGGHGFLVEGSITGLKFYDNILINPAICYRIPTEGSGQSYVNFEIYNNICVGSGKFGSSSEDGLGFNFDGNVAVTGWKVYNNLIYDPKSSAIYTGSYSGTATGNVFRNNIIVSPSASQIQLVNWAPNDASNVFTNNLVWSAWAAANPTNTGLIAWKGTNYNCSGGAQPITNIDATNKCANPQFKNTAWNDFHLNSFGSTVSPAIDAGTSTGMPSGRTGSINNTIADARGYPSSGVAGECVANGLCYSYQENIPQSGAAWDMGPAEVMLGDGGFESNVLGSPNWQTTGGCGCDVGIISSTVAFNGTYSGRAPYDSCVDGAASPCKGLFVAVTNLTVGQIYRITGLYYVDTAGESYWEILQHGVTATNPLCDFNLTSSTCAIHRETPAAVAAWLPFSAIFYAESTSHNLRFRPHHSTTSGLIYWDNITVRPN